MRRAGYAIVDKDGELVRDENCNLVFDIDKESMEHYAKCETLDAAEFAPYTVVPVFIGGIED